MSEEKSRGILVQDQLGQTQLNRSFQRRKVKAVSRMKLDWRQSPLGGSVLNLTRGSEKIPPAPSASFHAERAVISFVDLKTVQGARQEIASWRLYLHLPVLPTLFN